MPEYRRAKIAGGTYFFTVVTYKRRPFFIDETCRRILNASFMDVMERFPFTMDAICLLPDHLHCIWTLPDGDSNYSLRWSEIKKDFSQRYKNVFGHQDGLSISQEKRQEAGIRQRRFWEHMIRDNDEFNCHVEYIHFTPVKHGLVKQVKDWEWSSFHRYVKEGFVDEDWGTNDSNSGEPQSFGE